MSDTNDLLPWEVDKNNRSVKLAQEISNSVNTFSLDQEMFNRAMSMEHRTLQQSFTRLCLNWIKHCASPEYKSDARNVDSKIMSELIVRLVEKETGVPFSAHLPMI